MWKVKCVQVCNERGAIGTGLGTISRMSASDGWEFEIVEGFVLASKDDSRLRLPASLVIVEEQREVEADVEPVPVKGKRSREAA